MKTPLNLPGLFLLLVLFQGCNTLYNSKVVNMEIMEPGEIYISPEYKKVAVKYNNCNVSFNPIFAEYWAASKVFNDSTQTDSISSKIYFDIFIENLNKPNFFDSVIELEPTDFSNTKIINPISTKIKISKDTILIDSMQKSEKMVQYFTEIISNYLTESEEYSDSIRVHPKLGLYSEKGLRKIADSTNADVLFSLDFYSSSDGIDYYPKSYLGFENVFITTVWNIYDLNNLKFQNIIAKTDTVNWSKDANSYKELKTKLPPRRDAIFNAADIAGSGFAGYLTPHWFQVQRMYYCSGHIELKKAEKLVDENKWREAALIWKANVNNPNKSIAAKCKYNMALACEIEGDLEAALDWVVQSFHELGVKNEVHFFNCQQYIKIISQRRLDIKKIENQFQRNVL